MPKKEALKAGISDGTPKKGDVQGGNFLMDAKEEGRSRQEFSDGTPENGRSVIF